MNSLWKEFKDFAVKGNAIDMAVGIIIGAAFGSVVASLVKDIVTPPLGLVARADFSNLYVILDAAHRNLTYPSLIEAQKAGAVTWNYGLFLTTLINFLILAFTIFLVIRLLNNLKKPSPAAAPSSKDCPQCAMTIPIKARRCPHCTSEI